MAATSFSTERIVLDYLESQHPGAIRAVATAGKIEECVRGCFESALDEMDDTREKATIGDLLDAVLASMNYAAITLRLLNGGARWT